MDEYENNSTKFRQALDALNDRFRLRWKSWWSAELWQKLKALADAGRADEGLQHLPNNAPNLKPFREHRPGDSSQPHPPALLR